MQNEWFQLDNLKGFNEKQGVWNLLLILNNNSVYYNK